MAINHFISIIYYILFIQKDSFKVMEYLAKDKWKILSVILFVIPFIINIFFLIW